jgi:hypothetical protein
MVLAFCCRRLDLIIYCNLFITISFLKLCFVGVNYKRVEFVVWLNLAPKAAQAQRYFIEHHQ